MMRRRRMRAGLIFAAVMLTLGVAAAIGTAQTREDPNDVPWLGVVTQEITDELREGMSLEGDGVLVARVMEGSPADRAGIRKGDVITSINSRSVDGPDGLTRMIRDGRVGQSVTIRLSRDGDSRTVTAKLAARPAESEPVRRRMVWRDRDSGGSGEPEEFEFSMPDMDHLQTLGALGRGRLGVRVQKLNPDLAEYFDVRNDGGVLVLEVVDGSPAEKAGLKSGDVIVRVGDKAVDDPDALVQALRDEDSRATLTIVRKGVQRTVETELDEGPRALRLREMGPDDRRIVIRRPSSGPESEELRREIQSLRRELDALREKLRDLERR